MASNNISKIFKNGYRFARVFIANTRFYGLNAKSTTLTARIATFIDTQYIKPKFIDTEHHSNQRTEDHSNQTTKQTDDNQTNHDNQTSDDKQASDHECRIVKLQTLLSALEVRKDKSLQAKIDEEFCSRLSHLTSKELLLILNFLMRKSSSQFTTFKIYRQGLSRLVDNVAQLTREELLQVMFYVGLRKDQSDMLKVCLRALPGYDVNSLRVEEMCIVCNAAFRTSTRIKNKKILAEVCKILSEKLFILKDPALFVTFVKSVRHNREQTEDLLSTISCAIFFNKTYEEYSFTAICHILALYADYAYYDEALLRLLTDLAIKEIVTSQNIRNKDLTRFLWSLSMLYHFKNEHIETIINIIRKKLTSGHYQYDLEELISSLLSLAIMNFYPVDLITHALTPENIASIKNIKSRTKLRLNLLISCLYLEKKLLFRELNLQIEAFKIYNMRQQVDRRPALSRVFAALRAVAPGNRVINKSELSYEIPHLQICGITGFEKKIYKRVFVEVLDDYVTVKNRDGWCTGPMRLKLRLLERFDEGLIVVDADAIEEMTEKGLEDYLRLRLDACR